MKTKLFAVAALAALCTVTSSAQDARVNWYGFIRNYAHVDTHESVSGIADLFNYLPKDNGNDAATWLERLWRSSVYSEGRSGLASHGC